MKKILLNIHDVSDSIKYKSQLIGRNQRLISGVNQSRLIGMITGFFLTMILIGLPILYYKGGF